MLRNQIYLLFPVKFCNKNKKKSKVFQKIADIDITDREFGKDKKDMLKKIMNPTFQQELPKHMAKQIHNFFYK